jgi:hypothetical protein
MKTTKKKATKLILPTTKKHPVQINLEEEEYRYIKVLAAMTSKTMERIIITLIENKRKEENEKKK